MYLHSWTFPNAADQSCIYGTSDGHRDNVTHGRNFSHMHAYTQSDIEVRIIYLGLQLCVCSLAVC